jgi:hypothetical protein
MRATMYMVIFKVCFLECNSRFSIEPEAIKLLSTAARLIGDLIVKLSNWLQRIFSCAPRRYFR